MVAYSFKRQFAEPILAGTKRQTIRGPRNRHARPGEPLQLYSGMRTKHCRLIGRATCSSVLEIEMIFGADHRSPLVVVDGMPLIDPADLDAFAVGDGFENWAGLEAFWRENHGAESFEGVMISWGLLHHA